MKKLLLLLVLVVAAVIGWGVFRKNAPPQVNFTRVKRTTLVTLLEKVEVLSRLSNGRRCTRKPPAW